MDVDARTSNGNEVQGHNTDSQNTEITEKQKAKNRRASERRMFAKLTPHCKELLTGARERLGGDVRQQMRLRRGKSEYLDAGDDNGGAGGGVAGGGGGGETASTGHLNRYGGSGVSSHANTGGNQNQTKEER